METPGPGEIGSTPVAILEAVGHVAQRLVSSPQWEEAMPDVLERLGLATDSSRAHLFRNHRGDGKTPLTSRPFEWCAPRIAPSRNADHLHAIDWKRVGYGRWIELMEAGGPVLGLVKDFPAEERAGLEAQDVVATLSFPVFAGDDWWGAIGLDDCARERSWNEGEIAALRSAAAIIGASIQRHRAEAEYRELVENGPVMTYQESMPTGSRSEVSLHYLSPQVEAVVGYPPERWQDPEFWPSIVHPDDREAVLGEDEETVKAGLPFDLDYRIVASDGRILWINDRAVPVRAADGGIAYWQGFMLDITSRKEAEIALAAAEERYRFIVERGPLATYLLQFPQYPDLRPLYLSPQFEEIFGYPLERWQDPGFWDSLVHPDDLEMLHAEDMRAMQEGDFDLEYRMVAADGRIVWVYDKAEIVVPDDGAQIWRGYVMDVTQRRQAIEQREEALEKEHAAKLQTEEISSLKDVLLQSVSHDIRTPLAAILGMASTLAAPDMDLDDEMRREFAERIATNTTRLDRLVSDLLDLDRLSRGDLRTNLLTVDLSTIAREVADFADTQGREVVVETMPAVVQADPAKVERIIDNLLGNALKHTPHHARVWLRVEMKDHGALIVVEDEGDGIPDADRESVFDIYRRGSPAPGSGIGLSLVKRFAEIHGGRAWVAERQGGGASFRVWLPQTQPI